MAVILKYINTTEGIVLIPFSRQHDTLKSLDPKSAGAVMINDGHIVAYGGSISLGLEFAPGDTEAIKKMLGGK